MEDFDNFQANAIGTGDEVSSEAALETRAMALVLAGAIPPYIDLEETANSIQLVLGNPASLLPQKALMSG